MTAPARIWTWRSMRRTLAIFLLTRPGPR
jgi:hypothetical protein